LKFISIEMQREDALKILSLVFPTYFLKPLSRFLLAGIAGCCISA